MTVTMTGDCFEDFTEIQNGRHVWTSYFFVGAKFFKNWHEKKIIFYNHITHHLEMCRWFYWNLK